MGRTRSAIVVLGLVGAAPAWAGPPPPPDAVPLRPPVLRDPHPPGAIAPVPEAPLPRPLGPRHDVPPGAIGPSCDVRLEVAPRFGLRELRVRVFATASGAPGPVAFEAPCPRGGVALEGLPAGVAVAPVRPGRCGPQPRALQVPSRGRVLVDELVVRGGPAGRGPYNVYARPSVPSLQVCGGNPVRVSRDARGRWRSAPAVRVPDDEPVLVAPDAPIVAPVVTPPPPAPPPNAPVVRPPRDCPVCAFGCLDGFPSRKKDANGCTVCACESYAP